MKINSLWNTKIVNLLNLLAYKNFQDYSTWRLKNGRPGTLVTDFKPDYGPAALSGPQIIGTRF